MNEKRIVFVDYLRVIACFLVMLVHASENIYAADASGLAGNVFCATFGAFLLFSCIRQKQAPRWITGLSKLSFGMYLMHLFFLSNIATVFVAGDQSHPLVPVWLAIPCIAVLTFICCAITIKVISLVPGSKWIVG